MIPVDRSQVTSFHALDYEWPEGASHGFFYSNAIRTVESEDYIYEIQMWGHRPELRKFNIWRYGAFKDGVLYYLPRRTSDDEEAQLVRLLHEGLSPFDALEFIEL